MAGIHDSTIYDLINQLTQESFRSEEIRYEIVATCETFTNLLPLPANYEEELNGNDNGG